MGGSHHVAQAGLKLTVLLPQPLSAGIICMYDHGMFSFQDLRQIQSMLIFVWPEWFRIIFSIVYMLQLFNNFQKNLVSLFSVVTSLNFPLAIGGAISKSKPHINGKD
jgi:hypothetical protein